MQGWRIATGRSRDNILQFSQQAVLTAFVVWIALLGVNHSANIVDFIEGLQSVVTTAIAGDDKYQNPEKMVDIVMLSMQVMSNSLETYLPAEKAGGNETLTTGLLFVTGIGAALPALISGGLLLLNKIALYLCVMFAPLCLVAYIFEQTRFMFMAWAKFTVTTLFSLALITVITVIAMKVVLFVAAALILVEITGGGADLKSIATAQGGVGMLLTTLVLGAPPLITNFFSGAVTAGFNAYNNVGNLAGSGNGRPAGGPQDMGANTKKNDSVANVADDRRLVGTTKEYSGSSSGLPQTNPNLRNAPTTESA